MNNNKFTVIACVNDEQLWAQCEKHLDSLIIPPGYTLEWIKITGADNINIAYNRAMRQSDAKYKIYLHQDTFLLNKKILFYLLDLFSDPKIGMIGLMGGTRIPKSGVWYHDGLHSYGKILRVGKAGGLWKKIIPPGWNRVKVRQLNFLPVLGRYKSVACIDGFFMATQYDLPWREDLYGGFIYYDAPHSLKFIEEGYKVVVPRQIKAWCMHVGALRSPEDERKYREKFRRVLEIFRREYRWALEKNLAEITEYLQKQ